MADTDTDPAACSRILRGVEAAAARECAAYLAGAAHDGTFSRLHGTIRISQAMPGWLTVLQAVFRRLGSRSWVYREGARQVWVVESTFKIDSPLDVVTPGERAAYARGYFDAEGGMPRNGDSRCYIQMTQKDHHDLQQVREFLGPRRAVRAHPQPERAGRSRVLAVLRPGQVARRLRCPRRHMAPGQVAITCCEGRCDPGVGRRI